MAGVIALLLAIIFGLLFALCVTAMEANDVSVRYERLKEEFDESNKRL